MRKENIKSPNIFPAMEEEVLDFWEKGKIFEKSTSPRPSVCEGEGAKAPKGPSNSAGKDYVFYDGPPFGTGEPHYGHILSSVSKDVVPRYMTMKGYRVERRWGWDCHGLPIENIVEAEMGISGKKEIEKIGIDKFNEACRARVLEYADVWRTMIRRIARWVEFDNSYKTMDLSFMESVWWAFKELWNKDLIYQGRKVLLYCPRCETPISNFEVAMDNSYKDIMETSVYVKFEVDDPKVSKNLAEALRDFDGKVYILAWTTTPWTLPSNMALAVRKDYDYVMIKYNGYQWEPKSVKNSELVKHSIITPGVYIIAKNIFWKNMKENAGFAEELRLLADYYENEEMKEDLLHGISEEEFFKKYNVNKLKGEDLVGLEYKPLFDIPAVQESGKKAYYVVEADFVTTEDGTGIVHIAPVYGEADYNLGLEYGLPIIPLLDEKGHFNKNAGELEGIYFLSGNKKVIEHLKEKNLLFIEEPLRHSYPHCHRCATHLFYSAIPAWFVNIGKIKKRMLELNENINWYPEYLKYGRFALGIEQAPDWNISRNRYFATPIPIWECDKCGEREIVGSVKELEEKSGSKSITDIHSHRINGLKWRCAKCGGTMERINEVFDCWFESGSMPFAQHHYPFENKAKFEHNFPAQFISEYISQTRAWFYVMHAISTALFNSNSYENVAATGVILNEKGEKMSKSKKNFPDPWKVINEFGADALRFYLMNSTVMHAENLFFNERDLQDIYRKINMILWNVYKFYEMYAEQNSKLPGRSRESGAGKTQSSKLLNKNILDKWIIARLNELIKEVTESMDNYNLPKATRPIGDFINDLSTWYLRRSRDRFKGEDEEDKKEALNTMRFVLIELAKVMAPFMPFIAEQLWQRVAGFNFKDENKSVHLESWPISRNAERVTDNEILERMEAVRKIVELGLAKRDEAGIKVRQPLNKFSIFNFQFSISEYEDLIKDELNVKIVNAEKGEGELRVELDTEITPELKQEGIKRELVRFINGLRKDAGMTIKDRAVIYWQSKDEGIKQAVEKYKDEIMKDALADDMNENLADEVDIKKEVKVNGFEVWLGIKKL